MTCDNALEQMSAALDGELSAEETAQLDRHLAQCDVCRALFDDLTAIHVACAGLEVAPPPALKAQILQNLPARKKPGKIIWVHWKRWAAMAASFVLISLAAWQLPKSVFTKPAQPAAGQVETVQETRTTVVDSAAISQDVPEVADDQADINDTTTLSTSGSEEPSDVPPTPAPESFNGEPTVANAAPSAAPKSRAGSLYVYGGQKIGLMAAGTENETDSVANSVSQDTEDLSTYSGVSIGGGGAAGGASLIRFPVPVASVPPQMGSGEETAPTAASFDAPTDWDEGEHPEQHPDLAEEDNVPVMLFRGVVDENGATVYCGVLSLQGNTPLEGYFPQVQENGEIWYELPHADFYALVDALTDSGVDFDLRTTGDDVSSDAPMGLVVLLPQETTP